MDKEILEINSLNLKLIKKLNFSLFINNHNFEPNIIIPLLHQRNELNQWHLIIYENCYPYPF